MSIDVFGLAAGFRLAAGRLRFDSRETNARRSPGRGVDGHWPTWFYKRQTALKNCGVKCDRSRSWPIQTLLSSRLAAASPDVCSVNLLG